MTPHGIVTDSTYADAHELEAVLRMEDRRELEDLTGEPALGSLLRGVLFGDPAWTLRTHEGELAGLLFVVPFGGTSGVIAMSGTKIIEENRAAFLRGSRDVLSRLDLRYDTLFNVCDARNEVHVRWLRWLGFSIIRRVEGCGARGIPVYEFARISRNV